MVSLLDRVRGQPAPQPNEPEPEPEEFYKEMTLQEHLEELRTRLIYALLAVAVGFVIGLALAFPTMRLIIRMSGIERLYAITPTESFITYTKVALYLGIGFAMPMIVYQLVRFLAPGLTRKEKRYLYRALPFVSIMFVAGVAFAFFVLVPRALSFLSHFGGSVFEAQFRAEEVVSFYMTLLLWVGVVFELPVVIFILAKLGIVSAKRLAALRKFAILIIAVAAALITPTPDPFNMFLVAAPMYLLYELGVLLARFAKPV
ncbi:MAG: twin-arginine translocase subunit TatC [Thermomicrobium sp.]|jgi:sec-independent protein translocase protein TatC|nr:twin-arginine translocase subunit TatC [Thermomicrobium sp.]MBO9405315.1 twin-arginine translocase subunit TatC [Thermomicrobium sp.]